MASIWKHPKSRYWTACYRDVSGHQRRASTKETNRKRVQRIADEYEKASRSKRTLKQVQTVLDRLHQELSGARIVRTTVRARVASWLATKKPETAPATLYFYRNSLGQFLDFLGPRADHQITEVTKEDVIAFRNRVSTQVSAKTTNHDLRAVKSFFKSAREDDAIPEDPAGTVKGLQGIPAAVVQSLIGHDSEEVHQLYVAVGKEGARQCGCYAARFGVNFVRFLMPRKIRELIQDLKAAGWRQVSGGKGSHRKFKHDKFPGSVMIPGHENDDAKPYLEKQVRNAVKGKAHERK